jgi:hypothetical protein
MDGFKHYLATDYLKRQYEFSFKTLATVFDQQYETTEDADGEKMEIVIREKPKGDEIISTHTTLMLIMSKRENKRFAVKKILHLNAVKRPTKHNLLPM